MDIQAAPVHLDSTAPATGCRLELRYYPTISVSLHHKAIPHGSTSPTLHAPPRGVRQMPWGGDNNEVTADTATTISEVFLRIL